MPFTNNPNNPTDRVRMMIGDTDVQNEYISDIWYDHYLEKKGDNELLAAIEAAKAILVKFTGNTREIVDQVEIWGNDQFSNYLEWLKDFIENPSLSGLRSPVPYASGISKSDMDKYRCNSDRVERPLSKGDSTQGTTTEVEDWWFIRRY